MSLINRTLVASRLAAVACTALLLVGCADPRPATEALESAPDFFALTPAGDTVRVADSNALTLLNLWATWCGPCREEFPDLERIHRKFSSTELRVVAVDVDGDPPDVVQAFVDEMGATFVVASDPTGTISSRFRVLGLPSTYLLDANGVILRRWAGVLPPSAADTIAAFVDRNAEKS